MYLLTYHMHMLASAGALHGMHNAPGKKLLTWLGYAALLPLPALLLHSQVKLRWNMLGCCYVPLSHFGKRHYASAVFLARLQSTTQRLACSQFLLVLQSHYFLQPACAWFT